MIIDVHAHGRANHHTSAFGVGMLIDVRAQGANQAHHPFPESAC